MNNRTCHHLMAMLLLTLCSVGIMVSAQPVLAGDIIESRINGKFEGLDHGNTYELDNGQVWEQTEFYTYLYDRFNPDVTIFKASIGWEMKVEGVRKTVQVERVR